MQKEAFWRIFSNYRRSIRNNVVSLQQRFKERDAMMSTKYALFFDIDGTLVSFKTHEIPPSTIFALTQAKANGHRVYIATGRPPIIITNLGAIEHLIDGYITTNGALCFVGKEIVACQPINKSDVLTVVDDAKTRGYSLIVVGQSDVAVLDPHGHDHAVRQIGQVVEPQAQLIGPQQIERSGLLPVCGPYAFFGFDEPPVFSFQHSITSAM